MILSERARARRRRVRKERAMGRAPGKRSGGVKTIIVPAWHSSVQSIPSYSFIPLILDLHFGSPSSSSSLPSRPSPWVVHIHDLRVRIRSTPISSPPIHLPRPHSCRVASNNSSHPPSGLPGPPNRRRRRARIGPHYLTIDGHCAYLIEGPALSTVPGLLLVLPTSSYSRVPDCRTL